MGYHQNNSRFLSNARPCFDGTQIVVRNPAMKLMARIVMGDHVNDGTLIGGAASVVGLGVPVAV